MNDSQRKDAARSAAIKAKQSLEAKIQAITAGNSSEHNEKYITYQAGRGKYIVQMGGKYQGVFFTLEGARKRKAEILEYWESKKLNNEKYITYQVGRGKYIVQMDGKYEGVFPTIEGARKRKAELLEHRELRKLEEEIRTLENKLTTKKKRLEELR